MRALITSARAPHALTLIRGLARRGWTITAADTTCLSPGLYSRFASRRLVMPALTTSPGRWAAVLLTELGRGAYDLLVPAFEDGFLVAQLRRHLPGRLRVLCEDYAKQMRLHRKPQLAELARSVGCGVPDTWQPPHAEALAALAPQLPYPVVLKPPAANNSIGMTVAGNASALESAWRGLVRRSARHGGMPLIQRRVSGRHVSALAFGAGGVTLGLLCYEPVLMFPDGGGTAFWRRAIEHAEVEAASEAVLHQLGWTGFLGLDFIVAGETGRATGRPLLIDANPRPTPALHLGEASGAGFVDLVDAFGRDRPFGARRRARPGGETRTRFVHALWSLVMLLPGREFRTRVARVRDAWRRRRLALLDFHDTEDRRPAWLMALYVPFFMLVLEALAGARGGFMYACTYDGRTEARAGAELPRLKARL